MITLTYGRKKPENLDRGDTFFDALADNAVLDDAHTHNGVNSARITADAVSQYSIVVANTGWTAVGDGTHKKLVTMPGTFQYGSSNIRLYRTSDFAQVVGKLVKVTATTFEIHLFEPLAITVWFN